MGFRTVVIKNKAKLEYTLNYLVIRGETEVKIPLSDINTLIIQNIQTCITSALIAKITSNKIKLIFCDEKNNPCSELVGYYQNYSNYSKIRQQINWEHDLKPYLWTLIIKQKILTELKLLIFLNKVEASEKLKIYINEVEEGDSTNREGHAAKVYFNSLFGKDFVRGSDTNINKYLNYGYSIIASAINREIKCCGYLTEIGIHHIGETNPFNLTYDFIEPLRVIVDYYVKCKNIDEANYKTILNSILSFKVTFNGNEMFLENAIHLYILNLLNYLNGSKKDPIFVEYEF